jgi:nucleoside-diphosphate-sugar epimerase
VDGDDFTILFLGGVKVNEINLNKPILVTGGSGYMALWIIKLLLEKGRNVKATVRDKSNDEKNGPLLKMGKEYPSKLELFEADLLQNGSFEDALTDCELVIHNASPFKIWGIKEAQKELINPALEGTRNVLISANKTQSVKRIVLTSSVVAIYGDAIDIKSTPNGIFTENEWNHTSSLNHQPYSYSKTLAEKEALKIAEKQKQWDLVVINPGFVLGPSLTSRKDSTSIDFMLSMINGKYKTGVPDLYFGIVDVRDVAEAHILAGTKSSASGRHILVTDTLDFFEIANILKKDYGKYPLPKRKIPKFLVYLLGPLQGLSWKYIKLNVGIPIKFDNSYSKKDLGIEYTPIEKTLNDHVEQIIESGLLK